MDVLVEGNTVAKKSAVNSSRCNVNVMIPIGKKARFITKKFLESQAEKMESDLRTVTDDIQYLSSVVSDTDNGGNHNYSGGGRGSGDIGTDAQNKEKANLLLQKKIEIANAIDKTLRKISDGRYDGLCVICSSHPKKTKISEMEIGKARLTAVPTAETCVSCANGKKH
jgi:RNA polymerase-binding transcription factor DksA